MVFGRQRSGSSGQEPALLEAHDELRGSLVVGWDETVVLLGASEAGKTQILRALVGIGNRFDEVRLQGKPFSRERLAATVGWVPQNDGVFLSETIWGNVHKPRYVDACPKADALDALDWIGMADRANEPVSNLDYAGRRRVAFARAIARQRPLLIVDGELDRSLWPMFPALCKQFDWLHGVIVATATAEDLAWSASSVAPVGDGRIICQAPLAELVDSLNPEIRAVLAWTTP